MLRILAVLASGLPLALAWSVRGFAATSGQSVALSTRRSAAPEVAPAAAPQAAPAAPPAASPSASPKTADLKEPKEKLEVQKPKPFGTNCTCEKAFDSLGANSSKAECQKLQDSCSFALELGCSDKVNTCMGKFNQAKDGLIGFVLDAEKLAEASFCGPFGKCLGELRLVARVWRPEKDLQLACAVPSAVSSANATDSSASGCPDGKDCVKKCSANVKGKSAKCTIPMVPELAPGAKLTGSCWLETSKGTKVTDVDYFAVVNKYKKA